MSLHPAGAGLIIHGAITSKNSPTPQLTGASVFGEIHGYAQQAKPRKSYGAHVCAGLVQPPGGREEI